MPTPVYKAFDFEGGIIIVSKNPEVNGELALNPKWYIYRTNKDLYIFASTDIRNKLKFEGLPASVVKFVAGVLGAGISAPSN